MKCPYCNHENKTEAKFCVQCGCSLKQKTVKRKVFRMVLIVMVLVFVAGSVFILNREGVIDLGLGDSHYITQARMEREKKILEETTGEEFAENQYSEITTEDIQTTEIEENLVNADNSSTAIDEMENNTSASIDETENIIQLKGVDEFNTPNYDLCLSPDKYLPFKIDNNFQFYYPANFFDKVEKESESYYFSSDDDDTYLIACKEIGSGDAVKDVKQIAEIRERDIKIEDPHISVKNVSSKVKDGWAHCLVGGNYIDNPNKGVYLIAVSNGEWVYSLEFEYYDAAPDEYYTAQNYLIDCLYRYCEHSGCTYKPRTYEMFLKEDMGEKK